MKLAKEVNRHGAGGGFRPVIDTLGVGQGVTSKLREMFEAGDAPWRPLAFVGAASSKLVNLTREYGFVNNRSAAWWMVREALDPQNERGAMLPPDPELVADLTAPTWEIQQAGTPPKIRVQPKDKVKEKLGRSPDFGDAVAMAYWAGAQSRGVGVAKKAATGGQPFEGTTTMGPAAREPRRPTRRFGGAKSVPTSQLSPLGQGPTAKRTKGGL
jgi:hypothetical protein